MRGAAMSLKAAVSGLVIFLLSVSVVKGEDTWGVTHSSAQICAVKGSTVEIPCTYTYPSRLNEDDNTDVETFWYTKKNDNQFVDVKTDPDYSGRVEYLFHENVCTLRIKNLRERDSAVYKFMFTTNQPGGSLTGGEGVTLSITDLQVQVETKRNQAELKCYSSCNVADNPSYVWYRNEKEMTAETSSIRVSLYDHDKYSCSVKGQEDYRSPEVYAPKLLSVSVSPSAEIEKGSSVTLTCSSDANPAATFKWYKRYQTPQYRREGAQLVFNYIRPSASGEYYCEAENKLGRKRSGYVSINVKYAPSVCSASVSPAGEIRENSRVTVTCSCDANPAPEYTWYQKYGRELSKESELVFSSVQSSDSGWYYCAAKNDLGESSSGYVKVEVKYAPKLPSVSLSPSAEIVEGSSVTLTCSSDANPEPEYTWYKKKSYWDQTLIKNKHLVFSSVQSSDSGEFYCTAVNTVGSQKSKSISIDVKYSPKLPSVSLSPSAEIVEGSSVTLTCSSDANPAANYTWFKEDEDSPTASGQIFTISNFSADHSGRYYCEAQNTRGRHNSTLHLLVVAGNSTFIIHIIKWTLLLFMLISLLLLTLWTSWMLCMRTCQPSLQHRQKTQRSRNTCCEVQSDAGLTVESEAVEDVGEVETLTFSSRKLTTAWSREFRR
ncbi:B-cell receptor CD22-like isoform X2 [Labrus mixtus]|uniref:B-cell receptor CD22-like isoform X2 n=1 Tax=Labrus mixtus TaxID=508554 RepID=UPI0029C0A7D0|nr:B-cell receptor CD22-like isoform X2 [Labrus mixtus]